MVDMEKVIKGLENLREKIRTATQYTFVSGNICAMNIDRIDNAIALLKEQEQTINELQNAYGYLQKQFFEAQDKLLKEQEAVEPKKGWFLNNLNIPEEHWFCGKCDEELVGKCKYCANCGQAVKCE